MQGRLSKGAEGVTTPPIMFLEGHCPLKIHQSCDAVLYVAKFCSLKWKNDSVVAS